MTISIFEETDNFASQITIALAIINLLNAELNPICHLLTLLGVHHILHVGRIWVNGSGAIRENDGLLDTPSKR
jgi:hypothetical protein